MSFPQEGFSELLVTFKYYYSCYHIVLFNFKLFDECLYSPLECMPPPYPQEMCFCPQMNVQHEGEPSVSQFASL